MGQTPTHRRGPCQHQTTKATGPHNTETNHIAHTPTTANTTAPVAPTHTRTTPTTPDPTSYTTTNNTTPPNQEIHIRHTTIPTAQISN